MKIPKKMIKKWCGSFANHFFYNEAVDLIYSVLNNGTDKDDIIEMFEQHFIDNGFMSEEEFRKEVNDENLD
tara:strand:- start:496 stop:708 length:213 start_codon:yes stop_codon:yes gene_type:complete